MTLDLRERELRDLRISVTDRCNFRCTPVVVRFIEYMDVGATNGWVSDEVVPSDDEIVSLIEQVHPLEPVAAQTPSDVAARYRYLDGAGEIGVISSVTQPFCGDCTRLRLSADGKVHTCLFSAAGHDLLPTLRAGDGVPTVGTAHFRAPAGSPW